MTFKSWKGVVPVREIVKVLAGSMNLQPGPLTAIPEDATVLDRNVSGRSKLALDDILGGIGLSWWDDDGVLRVTAGEPQDDTIRVRVSERTGMVGSPTTTTERGARVRTLMNPLLRSGNVVELDSEGYEGEWNIVGSRHYGTNWIGDEFYSEANLKRVARGGPAE